MASEERRDEHGPAADVASADEEWAAVEETRETLRHLASPGTDPDPVIDRAAAAVDDLDAAAAFVDDVGVDGLARAVAAVEDPAVRARGERALAAFRRFRAAAAGDLDGAGDVPAGDAPTGERDGGSRSVDEDGAAGHFHPGHDTDLRDGAEATTE